MQSRRKDDRSTYGNIPSLYPSDVDVQYGCVITRRLRQPWAYLPLA